MIKKIIFGILILTFSITIYIGDKKNEGDRNFINLLSNKILNNNEEPINLIICNTPLQMVVAEKIMEQYPNEKFIFTLMTLSPRTDVFNYYYDRVGQKANLQYSFFYRKNSIISILEVKLKGLLLPKNIKTIFISSIDSPIIRTFIDYHSDAEIKTFDEGTINLISTSIFLNNDSKTFPIPKNLDFLNPKITKVYLREKTTEHFTIFKDLTNTMEIEQKRRKRNTKYSNLKINSIELFNYQIKTSNNIQDTIRILLGTKEIDLKETSEKVIEHFNIKYIAKHPGQKYNLDNATTLKSNLIIEDYILQEIKKNPHTQYEIYTFFSGAGIIMKNFPNVKIFAIKPTSFPNDYWLNPVYELFEKSNIPILEFDDNS